MNPDVMKSMTGFGHSKSTKFPLDVTVKGVNGRFLDIRFRLPRECSHLEMELKKIVAATFRRGSIDVTVGRKRISTKPDIQLNLEFAKELAKTFRKLAKSLKIKESVTLQQITGWPHVLEFDDELGETEIAELFDTARQAALLCDEERKREGAALQKELNSYIGNLLAILEKIEGFASEANERLGERVRDRIAKLKLSEQDEQRISTEIVFYADRSDISEEISRLKEHLRSFKKILGRSDAEGKKLDFYTQELLREMNTIGSKSYLAEVTELVVDGKTTIEKIREQVQNIE